MKMIGPVIVWTFLVVILAAIITGIARTIEWGPFFSGVLFLLFIVALGSARKR
jgi:hypothetical protein